MRKFALLSLATDASMVRKPCQPLEGKATQPIKQQAEKSYNYLFAGPRLHDKKFKSNHQTFSAEGRGRLGMRL